MIQQIRRRWRVGRRKVDAQAVRWSERISAWLRKQMDFSIRSLWIMTSIAALLVVINGVIFSISAHAVQERAQRVQHAQAVQTDLESLLNTLDEAETGQRGYLLTGDPHYLAPYTSAEHEISQDIADLQQQLRGEAAQQQHINALVPLIAAKMSELHQTVQLAQNGQAGAAMQIVRTNDGERTMTQIRSVISAMEADAAQTLNQRAATADRDLDTVTVTFVLGTLALLLVLLLLALAIQQMMRQRDQVAADRLYLLEIEQAAREHAENAVRQRDEFLSVASHELKNPITAISTTAQMLERKLLRGEMPDPRLKQMLDVQARQTRRLLLLIDGMLDATRIDRGHFTLNCAPVDLMSLIRPIASEMELISTRHDVQLDAPEEPIMLNGDAPRLEQVWYNLLQNAIKYSPGGGTVRVTVRRDEHEATVAIQDCGIGIPAACLPHMFEPYFRASNTKDRDISGLGIGLYVTKTIVDLHGGSIQVASVEGQGSTFTVRLPLLTPPPDSSPAKLERGERLAN